MPGMPYKIMSIVTRKLEGVHHFHYYLCRQLKGGGMEIFMELSDGLKKVFLAGVGAVATTAEAAKDLVDNLVTKGELTVEQGKVLNEELRRNAKKKVNDHVTVNIVREYKDVMNAVDHMTKEERDQLRERLNAADAQADNPTDADADTSGEDGAAGPTAENSDRFDPSNSQAPDSPKDEAKPQ